MSLSSLTERVCGWRVGLIVSEWGVHISLRIAGVVLSCSGGNVNGAVLLGRNGGRKASLYPDLIMKVPYLEGALIRASISRMLVASWGGIPNEAGRLPFRVESLDSILCSPFFDSLA